MKFKRDIIIMTVGVVIVAALSGYYYFQSQIPTEEEVASEQIDRIATLTIIRDDLDEATKQQFREQFDAVSAKFLADQSIASFFVVNAIGRIKQDVGDFQGAEEAYLFAYRLDSGGYIINGNIANLYQYGLKDYINAEQFYLDTLAINGIQSGNHYTYFAEIYELYFYRIKDTAKAEELLARALEELPENLNIISLAAEHYKRIDNKEKARELFEQMLELDPGSTVAAQGLESLN